jgi:hypothetical protein
LSADLLKRNEGTLEFTITKLSSYKQISKVEDVYSTNVLYLHNLPFRICVQFKPNEEKNDVNIGIFVNGAMIKERFKTE